MLNARDVRFELRGALEALGAAGDRQRIEPDARSSILEAIAAALEDARPDVLRTASEDTALSIAELEPEFARMTGTLRMFAALARGSAWARPALSPPADSAIGPNHDLRSTLVPLGPVAVFGASNFPLAYGVCGGDTASALAAGCPVIVKEHPAHIRTGRLLIRIARHGLARARATEAFLGYASNPDPADLAIAHELVLSPQVRAIGFTGSRRAGLAIEELARSRPDRIPVFAEMGSANPVIITPRAVRTRGPRIGEQIADSILARFGQQCTCPGIICVPDAAGAGRPLVDALAARIAAAAPRDMLSPWIRDSYTRRLSECLAVFDVRLIAGRADPGASPRSAHAALLRTSADRFAWHTELREEIFGPGAIVVDVADGANIPDLPLPPSLTLSIFCDPDDATDIEAAGRLAYALEHLAGRIIFNGVPTGVRVAEAMVHGGPFPASNRPDTTAVGPRAIERWCRPVCWQSWPAAPSLQP